MPSIEWLKNEVISVFSTKYQCKTLIVPKFIAQLKCGCVCVQIIVLKIIIFELVLESMFKYIIMHSILCGVTLSIWL